MTDEQRKFLEYTRDHRTPDETRLIEIIDEQEAELATLRERDSAMRAAVRSLDDEIQKAILYDATHWTEEVNPYAINPHAKGIEVERSRLVVTMLALYPVEATL